MYFWNIKPQINIYCIHVHAAPPLKKIGGARLKIYIAPQELLQRLPNA